MKKIKNFKVGDKQCFVEAYPKEKKHERSDIDVLRLSITELDTGRIKNIDMTPDEALEIGANLVIATQFWLMNYKPYHEFFMKRKGELDKKLKKSKQLCLFK